MKPVAALLRYAAASCLLGTSLSSSAAALEEIYQKALYNDAQLKVAEATLRSNQEILPQAKAALLPSINGTADTTYYNTSVINYNNHGYSVSLVQPVFSAAKWFAFKRGQILDKQAALSFDLAQQNLILRVVNGYLTVLNAKSNLETAQAQERAIKRRLDQVNAQFEVGLIAITDVQEAKASYDAARVSLIESKGALDNSFEALERIIGEQVTDIDELSEDYPIQQPEPATPEEWVDAALENNIGLQVASFGIDASRRAAQAAKSGHLPTLDFSATYDRDNGSSTRVGWVDGWVTSKVVGLSLSVPLFQGGAIQSQTRQAYAELDVAHHSFEDTYRDVKQSTRSLLRDIETSVLSVSARRQSIISSQASLDATSEGFNVGTRNVVDVLTAEQALYAAKRDYAAARFGYIANLFALKQQIGSLSPADIKGLDEWLITQPE
jgi:outer membrane protein